MIYKGEDISIISTQDNGHWYFHVPVAQAMDTIKPWRKQTAGKERVVTIDNTEYMILSGNKSEFSKYGEKGMTSQFGKKGKLSEEWTYEKLTQGQMISVMAHFQPGDLII